MGFIFATKPKKLEPLKQLAQEIASFTPAIKNDCMHLFKESDILRMSAPEHPIQTATFTVIEYIRN